jgi:hypothetical protein
MTHRLSSRQQRGVSFFGVLVIVVLLAAAGVLVARIVPTAIEYQGVLRAIQKAKAGSTPAEVRSLFDKAAAVDDIHSISGKDLEVTKVGDAVVVKFDYNREFHLGGPAYLTLKYRGQSE